MSEPSEKLNSTEAGILAAVKEWAEPSDNPKTIFDMLRIFLKHAFGTNSGIGSNMRPPHPRGTRECNVLDLDCAPAGLSTLWAVCHYDSAGDSLHTDCLLP